MSWTDDRIEELRRMWAEGLSASQIAGALGGVTRNAVIGKIHRLGLSGRVKASPRPATRTVQSKPVARQRTAAPRVMAVGSAAVKVVESAYDVAPEPVIEAQVVPLHTTVSLLDLSANRCRWPIGDPADAKFAFCGGRTEMGETYCKAHAEVAYPARRKSASR